MPSLRVSCPKATSALMSGTEYTRWRTSTQVNPFGPIAIAAMMWVVRVYVNDGVSDQQQG